MAEVLETELWRSTPEFWACPGCLRYKPACEVPKGDGQTLRWLVVHHDHMADYAKAYVKRRFGGLEKFCAAGGQREEALQFIDRLKRFSKRFDDVPLCLDCNEIEGKIKQRIGADKYFTFHPHELRRAMMKSPNERHYFVEEHMDFYRRFYAYHAPRLVDGRKRTIEGLVDQAHEHRIFWANAARDMSAFSDHELLAVFPEFDSGQRIAQAFQAGKPALEGAPWIDSHDATLARMQAEGASVDEVARHLGRTPNAIAYRLRHLRTRSPRGS